MSAKLHILDLANRTASTPIHTAGRADDGLRPLPNYLKEPKNLTTKHSRTALISASRNLYKNNGIVKGAIDMKAEYAVGKAFSYKSLADNPDHAALYTNFIHGFYKIATTTGHNFHSLLYTISTALDVDGDAFILLTRTSTGFPKLQFIRANRISSPKNGIIATGPYKGLHCHDGIIYNKYASEFAYWLDSDDPANSRIIPASSLLHVADVDYLSTSRGEPLFAHALREFQYLDDINSSELGAMKIASQIALIEKSETGTPDLSSLVTTPNPDGGINILSTGDKQIRYLKSDASLDTLRFERPSPNYLAYHTRLLHTILAGVGIPYDIVMTPDSNGVGNRVSLAKFDATVRDRTTLLEEIAHKLISYALATAITRGDLPATHNWHSMLFSKPKRPSVDLGRDSAAQLNEYNAGIKNLTDICAENGIRLEDHLATRATEAALAEKFRLQAETKHHVTIPPNLIRNI